MITELDDVLVGALQEAERQIEIESSPPVWTPQPGPQAAAYESEADIIGYGGAAGGGKTDLLLGFAGTKHTRAIIFRREFPRLEGIEARSREIFNANDDSRLKDRYNETLHRWELNTGAVVRFAAMKEENDKRNYQGRPYDFYGFDEVTEFTESQMRFVMAWNRTTVPGQKCRIVLTFNPPMDEAEEWVTRHFAPWLDKQHPHPAADGELRWYAMIGGKEVERPNNEPFEHEGETITPRSRTFYHAGLADNPILASTGYGDTINALPEPLRSLLKGDFDAAKVINPWQVIPTEWIRAAMKRWTPERPMRVDETPVPMTAVGADLARGGPDQMVIAPMYETWYGPLIVYPGAAIPDGPTAAALIVSAIEDSAQVGVDVISIGASGFDSLTYAGIPAMAINNSESAGDMRDRSGRLKFRNVRAASYWKLREALDPTLGDNLALPDDPELLADLAAPRFKVSASGVLLEDKKEIKDRLGRSPDKGDAVVMAHWSALHSISDLIAW